MLTRKPSNGCHSIFIVPIPYYHSALYKHPLKAVRFTTALGKSVMKELIISCFYSLL